MRRLRYISFVLLCVGCSCFAAASGNVLVSESSPISTPPTTEPEFGRFDATIDEVLSTPDETEGDPNSMLRDAITKRELQDIKAAISKGANPNGLNQNMSVLDWALLVYCAGSSDPVNEREQDACLQMLTTLFNGGAKLRQTDRFVLYSPVSAGFPKVVEVVLAHGAKADGCSDDGWTWVEVAEAHGRKSVADVLVKHGGKPVRPQDACQLRLVQAARRGRFRHMERAIREGASVDEPDKTGLTPLTAVVGDASYDCERYAMLLFLLRKGADPSKEGHSRIGGLPGTPLHTALFMTARAFDHWDGVSELEPEESFYARMVLETLLEAGARVASRGEDGQTPLHVAAQWNNVIGAEILLKAGSTVMPRDNAGKTPLDYAESADMIRLLKDHGAREP